MKPRLLVLTSTFPRWRNDTTPPFVYLLAKNLTADFDVRVLAPHSPGSRVTENMEGIAVQRFRYFPFSRFEKLAGNTSIIPTLQKNKFFYLLLPLFLTSQLFSTLWMAWKYKPHTIHAHWILPQGLFALFVNYLTGIPFLVTGHGGDVSGLQNKLCTFLKKKVLNRAANITVVSEALQEKVLELAPDSSPHILPMGVDVQLFSPLQKSQNIKKRHQITGPFLLFVGRFTRIKGVKYLLAAMPAVLQKLPTAKLILIGSGELQQKLQEMAVTLNIEQSTVFLDALPNEKLAEYYASADIFISPSITLPAGEVEGFGLTFVEAALSGCLLIGTNSGGISDIIYNDRTGFLVPERDSIALSNKIIYGLSEDHTVEIITQNARTECSEKYDWKMISTQFADLLTSSIDSQRGLVP